MFYMNYIKIIILFYVILLISPFFSFIRFSFMKAYFFCIFPVIYQQTALKIESRL